MYLNHLVFLAEQFLVSNMKNLILASPSLILFLHIALAVVGPFDLSKSLVIVPHLHIYPKSNPSTIEFPFFNQADGR